MGVTPGYDLESQQDRHGGRRRNRTLFIGIVTFEPEKRDEIIKRRLEKVMMIPEGLKVLGEFLALRGHLVFYLFEADDPEIFYTFFHQWSDLMRCDLLPVMSVGPRFKGLVKQ